LGSPNGAFNAQWSTLGSVLYEPGAEARGFGVLDLQSRCQRTTAEGDKEQVAFALDDLPGRDASNLLAGESRKFLTE